jgi:hypothetical protein
LERVFLHSNPAFLHLERASLHLERASSHLEAALFGSGSLGFFKEIKKETNYF